MSDCIRAMKTAVKDGTLTDAQAQNILTRMENIARARKKTEKINVDLLLKDIAGEMKAGVQSLTEIDKRNRLLSIMATRRQMEKALAAEKWGVEFEKTIERMDSEIRGLSGRFLAPFFNKIEELGLTDIVTKQEYAKEFFEEIHNVDHGNTRPLMAGEIGQKIHELAKFYTEGRRERNGMKNRVGTFHPYHADYGFRQTHSTERLRALGGKMDDGNKARAKERFMELVDSVNIDETRTYEGRDRDLFWNNVFNNIYEGRHLQSTPDGVDIDKFSGVHGSLANKLSENRLIWFADAESQFKWNEALGVGNYFQLMMHEIKTSARSIVLMSEFGPNWRNNVNQVYNTLLDMSVADESGKQGRSFMSPAALERRLRVLSGEIDIAAEHPKIARIVNNVVKFTHLTKMGGVTFSSFGDVFHVSNALAQNGMKRMDAFAHMLSTKSKQVIAGSDVVASGFIGALSNRFGIDAFSGGLDRANHWMFKLNLFNAWNDTMQETIAHALSWWLGTHADRVHADLPEGLRNQLSKSGIDELEWEAVRSIARPITEGGELYRNGERFVLVDEVSDVPDAIIDRIVQSKGQNVTGPNRRRARDELAIRLSSYFSSQKDLALNNPTMQTRLFTTLGAQQSGTLPRELANLLMMFKSFPVTVTMNLYRRAKEAGIFINPADWEKRQWSFISQTAGLIAMTSFAGYVSITSRDILNGRSRRKLIDDDGHPNLSVFLKAAAAGGGLGIMGDFLFSEYDRQYKSVTGVLAGPVAGLLDPIGAIATGTKRLAAGEETSEHPLGEAFNLASNNLPFANLFWLKPLLNTFVFWNIREALSPGVMHRVEKTARDQNYQETWLSPVDISSIPITNPGKKAEHAMDQMSDYVRSLFE